MKIGIVGAGFVGATTAYALVMRGIGRQIVLVDRDAAKAAAEADDLLHAVPFAHPLDVMAGGYPDLAGARVVVLTAGAPRKADDTRLQLVARNAGVLRHSGALNMAREMGRTSSRRSRSRHTPGAGSTPPASL